MTMETRRRIFSISLLFGLCCLLTACPYESPPGSFYPVLAFDELNSRYLSVFVKEKTGDYYDQHSRLTGVFIDGAAGTLGGEFTIAEGKGFICPSLVYDKLHARYLAVWNADTHFYGQLINADGTNFGSRLTLSETAEPPSIRCSGLAFDEAQEIFLAVWGEQNEAGYDSVYARLIGADGVLAAGKVLISTDGAAPAWPSVAYDSANGRFFAVWDNAENSKILGRIISADGSVIAEEIVLYSADGLEFWPKVAYDSVNARFLITWEHLAGDASVLLGQFANADGTPSHELFPISSSDLFVYRHASVYDSIGNRFLIVFGDYTQEEQLQKIYSQIVPAEGLPAGYAGEDAILLSYDAYGGDRRPTIACDTTSQRCFAAWSYGSGEQQFSDIHGRQLNADGTPSGQIYILSNGGIW
jgi:hypothetical protein